MDGYIQFQMWGFLNYTIIGGGPVPGVYLNKYIPSDIIFSYSPYLLTIFIIINVITQAISRYIYGIIINWIYKQTSHKIT